PGFAPLTFLGNHDTTRIASQLADGRDLAAAIALLALLPGIPAVYAGDELGAVGVKEDRPGGDDAVRPPFPEFPLGAENTLAVLKPEASERILEAHRRLLGLRRRHPWLATARAGIDEDTLSNTWAQIDLSGQGEHDGEHLQLVLNLDDEAHPAPGEVLDAVAGADMIDGVGPAEPGTIPAHGIAVIG
ncbi:MAG: alpha-amylase family glycosyl hydrolase, partial [Brachybacterium sp.]|nr:alpha-amylase family glycosyl hydrolase [Brachybacterium sp.]